MNNRRNYHFPCILLASAIISLVHAHTTVSLSAGVLIGAHAATYFASSTGGSTTSQEEASCEQITNIGIDTQTADTFGLWFFPAIYVLQTSE
jgi:hypothetical protein